MPRRRILLDACIAINLAATDSLEVITETLDMTFVIVQQAATEVGYLRDIIDGELVHTPINLLRFAAGEVLEVLELAPPEFAIYLELATLVDDGEAATIAVAIQRGLEIATDDRRARRLCQERQLAQPIRTLAMLRSYAEAAKLSGDQVRGLLTKVRDRASFLPPRADPDFEWWNNHIGDA